MHAALIQTAHFEKGEKTKKISGMTGQFFYSLNEIGESILLFLYNFNP